MPAARLCQFTGSGAEFKPVAGTACGSQSLRHYKYAVHLLRRVQEYLAYMLLTSWRAAATAVATAAAAAFPPAVCRRAGAAGVHVDECVTECLPVGSAPAVPAVQDMSSSRWLVC